MESKIQLDKTKDSHSINLFDNIQKPDEEEK